MLVQGFPIVRIPYVFLYGQALFVRPTEKLVWLRAKSISQLEQNGLKANDQQPEEGRKVCSSVARCYDAIAQSSGLKSLDNW